MITYTKTLTITKDGATSTLDVICKKMDEKMFKHYSQNPLGMTKVVREHFNIAEDKNFSVSMWPEGDSLGNVYVMPKPKKKDE